MSQVLTMFVAVCAGGLGVYLYFATKPAGFDEPANIVVGGVSIQQVAGAGDRTRILLAAGALLACLIFLAGSLSTLP